MLAACAPSPCLLRGCTHPRLAADPARHKPCQKPAAYLQDFMLVSLDPEYVMPDSAVLPMCTNSPQAVVMVEYKPKAAGPMRQIAAPFDLQSPSPSFPAVREMMQELDNSPYTLHDVRLYTMSPDKPSALSTDKQWQRMLHEAHRLTSLEEGRIYIRLVPFFMRNGYRDAAYIAMENAKKALARASKEFPDKQADIKVYVDEVQEVEGRLKNEMPFSL